MGREIHLPWGSDRPLGACSHIKGWDWLESTAPRSEGRGEYFGQAVARMSKLFGFLGASVGAALVWWLGADLGPITQHLLSTLAGGAGFFYGRKLAANLTD